MHFWMLNQRFRSTLLLRRSVRTYGSLTVLWQSIRPRVSMVNCAPINATDWVGWIISSDSDLAAFWPTTWAWAKRSKFWRFYKDGEPIAKPKGHRWQLYHARLSLTGFKRLQNLPLDFVYWTTLDLTAMSSANFL